MASLTLRRQKCHGCGKRIFVRYSHTEYCPMCARLAIRMAVKKFEAETVKKIWAYVRKHGCVCYYTGMHLDMEDIHSPWYCVFDHWMPRDGTKIVLTSALLNEMKANLLEKEFWYIIKQLANHKRKNTKVRKIKLALWERHYSEDSEYLLGLKVNGQSFLNSKKSLYKCSLCGKPVLRYNAKYCPLCAKFAARLHSKQLPPETIEDTLNYVRHRGYTCKYSGIALELNNPGSPWYWQLDHWIPQDTRKIVLTCALFNVMKSDLSESEFWYYVKQLADFKEKGKKVRKKKLAYWWRLYPVEDA